MKKEKPKQRYIFRPYITKNGKRIYPKNGKVFKIPVEQVIYSENVLDGSFSLSYNRRVIN